jgi:zinc resistance-associated protein
MRKSALAATAAIAIAGHSLVYAQQRSDDAATGPDSPRQWRQNRAETGALTEERLAALKAELGLTPGQHKNWPAFEQAYRDLAKSRFEQHVKNKSTGNLIERLRRRADALTARGTALKHLADAAAPLYQSLDDSQKKHFILLSQPQGSRQ